MASYRILPHYTYEDWISWEGHWEIIGGIPFAATRTAEPPHQHIVGCVGSVFSKALKGFKNCNSFPFIDYKISDDTILQPDLLIVCGNISKKFLDFPPSLVVEVLSPSTALKDRHTKYDLYEQQQVKYYLIVSPDIEEVEVFALENNKYELKQKGHDFTYSFSFEEGCEATIDFKEIW